MVSLFKNASAIALGAAGVLMWIYTPWWVWSAGLVTGGLGILTFGSLTSYVLLGAAGVLFLFGYAVQPDAVTLFELLSN